MAATAASINFTGGGIVFHRSGSFLMEDVTYGALAFASALRPLWLL